MKGLLLKDYYIFMKNCWTYLLVALVFMAVSLFGEGSIFYMMYPAIIIGMVPTSLLSYDEQSHWDSYCDTLPYSRAQAVTAKYLLSLCSSCVMLILTTLVLAGKMGFHKGFLFGEFFGILGIIFLLTVFAPSITLPLAFKYGMVKARIAYFICVGMICGIGAAFLIAAKEDSDLRLFLEASESQTTGALAMVLPFAVGALIFAASWRISIAVYKKREL